MHRDALVHARLVAVSADLSLSFPPVFVIPCSPRWMDAPVAFSAGSTPISAAATSAKVIGVNAER